MDALQDLIGAVAYQSPTLVVIDDLQASDAPSLAVLTQVVTRLDTTPCMFVLACRTPFPRASPLQVAVDSIADRAGTRVIALPRLGVADVTELLLLSADRDHRAAHIERLATEMVAIKGGAPALILELLQVLSVRGDGDWRIDSAVYD